MVRITRNVDELCRDKESLYAFSASQLVNFVFSAGQLVNCVFSAGQLVNCVFSAGQPNQLWVKPGQLISVGC